MKSFAKMKQYDCVSAFFVIDTSVVIINALMIREQII